LSQKLNVSAVASSRKPKVRIGLDDAMEQTVRWLRRRKQIASIDIPESTPRDEAMDTTTATEHPHQTENFADKTSQPAATTTTTTTANDGTPDRKKRITVMTPTYNEEENVRELYQAVKEVFASLPQYEYDHLFIDNASKDRTAAILKEIAREDKKVKVIINTRNFGHIRSPFYAMLQAQGDVVVTLVADFQDPPAMIKQFLDQWEQGYKVVLGVKTSAEESSLMYGLRGLYYNMVRKLSDVELLQHVTGFGLYDQQVIEVLRKIDDPYPYGRGLIADIGFEVFTIPYKQPLRRRGITKNNFYTLYDVAMLGFTNHTKVPLRAATMTGFLLSGLSLLIAFGYFMAKLLFWNTFSLGVAPLIVGMFFFSSVQLFFIGVLGEYIGAIHTQVQKRPLVIEKERINF
jgi:glycosyltransferase involved in cell wall biosynthesis